MAKSQIEIAARKLLDSIVLESIEQMSNDEQVALQELYQAIGLNMAQEMIKGCELTVLVEDLQSLTIDPDTNFFDGLFTREQMENFAVDFPGLRICLVDEKYNVIAETGDFNLSIV
jgi:hypothetical protein